MFSDTKFADSTFTRWVSSIAQLPLCSVASMYGTRTSRLSVCWHVYRSPCGGCMSVASLSIACPPVACLFLACLSLCCLFFRQGQDFPSFCLLACLSFAMWWLYVCRLLVYRMSTCRLSVCSLSVNLSALFVWWIIYCFVACVSGSQFALQGLPIFLSASMLIVSK
jgi:hypothetical protein